MTPVEQHHHRGRRDRDPGRLRPAGPSCWTLVSIGTLVAFITVSIGVIILRVREPDLPRAIQGAGLSRDTRSLGPRLPWRCSTACAGSTWLVFGVWVAVVLVFYFVWGRHHSALNDGGDGLIPTAAPGEDEVTRSTSTEGRAVTRRRRIPRRQGRPIGTAPRRRGGPGARRPHWSSRPSFRSRG